MHFGSEMNCVSLLLYICKRDKGNQGSRISSHIRYHPLHLDPLGDKLFSNPIFSLIRYFFLLAGLLCVLGPPILPAQLLVRIRAGLPHPLAARHDPRGADRPHGQRLLHHGPHHRTLPRRLLPLPAKEVRCRFFGFLQITSLVSKFPTNRGIT